MELRQLRSLIAVQEAGSFSLAAEILDTVQSNVSNHISKLEHELNVILVDRRTGQLTEEGMLVASHARNLLAELEQIYLDLGDPTAALAGKVRLGIITTAAVWLLPRLLDAIDRNHPRIELEITEGTSASLERHLSAGLIDLAILTAPLRLDDLFFELLFEEPYVLVLPHDEEAPDLEAITVADAAKRPLLVPPPHVSFREELEAMAAARGTRVTPKAQIDGLHLIAILALSGYGPAILPSSAIAGSVDELQNLKVIPIKDLPSRRVGIGRHKSRLQSAASRAVADQIRALGGVQVHMTF